MIVHRTLKDYPHYETPELQVTMDETDQSLLEVKLLGPLKIENF